jgi:hypothetical protein
MTVADCERVEDVNDDVPMVGEFVRFVCAFCGCGTEDDPRYAHLNVNGPYSGESQSLGAHAACLRAVVRPSIPLPVE